MVAMVGRALAIAMNTYREAVRAWVLLGLLGAALGVSAYSLVIAAMSVRQEMRIVADIGAASISLMSVLTSIILGATSLYRELEMKTVFPILTRQLKRHEYVVGKFLGICATLLVFIAIDGAAVLGILALQSKQHVEVTASVQGALLLALGGLLWRAKRTRVFVLLPWSLAAFASMALLADSTGGERQVVLASSLLTLSEVAVVTAVSMLFSAFSSPFLTAIFTFMVFMIGRSADTLGNLPARQFGTEVRAAGIVLAKVVPNLNAYVPARPLLLGQVASIPLGPYLALGCANAVLYAVLLLAASAVIFRRRDFQ
jgi:ABC-type transport system involved in multi-copper enzyme maturation permease subunit